MHLFFSAEQHYYSALTHESMPTTSAIVGNLFVAISVFLLCSAFPSWGTTEKIGKRTVPKRNATHGRFCCPQQYEFFYVTL